MGGKCCTDRKEGATGVRGGDVGLNGTDPRHDRKSVAGYDMKKRAASIGYNSKGDDAEKFDKAVETNDMKAFVRLLPSKQPIEPFEERMHPWAVDPKTVGALAGTQLAMVASAAETDNPGVKLEINAAGGIPPLVDFLRSGEEDRVQTAVVALSFLTESCSANTVAAYDAGAMHELLKLIDSDIAGMRAATATTLRNICLEEDTYRDQFVQLGGLKSLVKQLGVAPDPSLNHADVQLEAVLNLQDLIEDEDGAVIEDYARKVAEAGAEPLLQQLAKSEDEEVRSSAEEVLALLQKVST